MKRFSAQYVFSGCGPPLKRGIITTEDDGTTISLEDTGGNLTEKGFARFYNGIIIPGFVNCHCHLELSHLKGVIESGFGLGDFLMNIRSLRNYREEEIIEALVNADRAMYNNGISLCADICNTSLTFGTKKKSSICYINLLEVFGIDSKKAAVRFREISNLAEKAAEAGLRFSLVPHTPYSVSLPLFRMLKDHTQDNEVTSIHFMETEGERQFLEDHSGPVEKSYRESRLLPDTLDIPGDHVSTILDEVTSSGNLILVHNTFADEATVRKVNKRVNTYWCLCPASNMYIEKKLPPVEMLMASGCRIVTGTDSLASNTELDILSELKILSGNFPSADLGELIKWSPLNGAEALGMDHIFGSIEPGKKPGLLLLRDADLVNLRLLPGTNILRLI